VTGPLGRGIKKKVSNGAEDQKRGFLGGGENRPHRVAMRQSGGKKKVVTEGKENEEGNLREGGKGEGVFFAMVTGGLGERAA